MTTPSHTKREELEALRSRVRELEAELGAGEAVPGGEVSRDYPAYFAAGGFLLGLLAAVVSLLFNVVGSIAAGKNPLELIRIYLTFPLGEKALRLAEGGGPGAYAVSDGVIVALGCCLYIGTGMLLGIPVALAISKFAPRGSVGSRVVVGGVSALLIWALNFYGILSWLQPLLFGGRWIVDNSLLPWWVAAATHAVFGATVALLYPTIQAAPEHRPAAAAAA
ncbi:MAG: hypothetical protein U0835_03965 [Isosphaeraceae bacterium]